MRLESVQVGHIRTAGSPDASDPFERHWTSGIWKLPVAGVVEVGPEGIPGDQIADRTRHGGREQALLVYPADHYPRWQEEWGTRDVVHGSFGENLTVSGVTERTACLGDVLAIGTTRLEVSCPRGPCHKLARRHGRKDLVEVVRQNHRHGWYLRVLEPGQLEAGQEVRVLDRPYPQWTVARVAALRWHHATEEEARLLQACSAVSAEWRDAISRKAAEG